MARIAGRPFLEPLLRQLQRHRFQCVILAVDRQSDMVGLHFGRRAFGLGLIYSAEPAPLGTGGALGHAEVLVQSGIALVTNGDSYTDVDLSKFVTEHRATGADLSLVVWRVMGGAVTAVWCRFIPVVGSSGSVKGLPRAERNMSMPEYT